MKRELIPGYNTASHARFPIGKDMPEYIVNADGAYVIDNLGKEYIDWTASLGSIIRGYQPTFSHNGQVFHSLPMASFRGPILAELLCDIYPADRARFFKTGSDATDAAVMLSRYVTGRDVIAFSGYHGWHDTFSCAYGRVGAFNLGKRRRSCHVNVEPS